VHVDVEDLWFSGYQPEAAWYESQRFLVSLHPSSSRSPCLERPLKAPSGEDSPSECMVSSGRAVSSLAPSPGSTESSPGRPRLGMRFDEHLQVRTDQLGTHLAMYLWYRKSSVFADEEKLLGCRAVPLRDASLHGRLAAWDVFDIERNLEIAQVRLRVSLESVPGAIQLPHLSDVQPTSLRLNWSLPLEDYGRPVLGYRVAILAPGALEWATACDCVKGTSFLLEELTAGTVYLVDIRAVNEVGAGDALELEVATAVEDDAASLGPGPLSPAFSCRAGGGEAAPEDALPRPLEAAEPDPSEDSRPR